MTLSSFRAIFAALAQVLAAPSLTSSANSNALPPLQGIVRRPDTDHTIPHGDWNKLGAHELLVQWTAVDRIAFVGRTTMQPSATMPDWNRNARVPWARDVIIGLAGRFSENAACADTAALLHESAQRVQLALITLPMHVIGRASSMAPGSRRSSVKPPRHTKERYRTRRSTRMWFYALPVMP